MTTCPACDGRKTMMTIHRNRTMRCPTCHGDGTITDAKATALIEGERRRRYRIERGLSIREEAARLGITPQELNRVEFAKDVK